MPNVPKYTMNAGVVEGFPLPGNLQGSVRADFSYRDGSFDNLPNVGLDQPTSNYASGYGIVNLRATVEAKHWNASVYADNLFNRFGSSFTNYDPAGLDQIYQTRPLTVGIKLGMGFK